MRTLTIATALSTLLIAVGALVLALTYDAADAGPVPPDLTVNSTADPGVDTCDVTECTLREAITAANAAPGSTIVFDIPGCPSECTISPADALPYITSAGTVIDGTTQPGYTDTPVVIVDGSALSSGEDGLYMPANDTTLRGLVVQNFPGTGVNSSSGAPLSGTTIEGNIIRDNGTFGIALNGSDHVVTDNVIEGNGEDGVGAAFAGAGTGLLVDGNEVSDNGGNGIRSTIADTTLTNNVVSGSESRGIDVGEGHIVATGNIVTDSGSHGLFVSGDTSVVTGNTATGNGRVGIIVGGGPATVSDNISNDNGFAFQNAGIGTAGINPGDGFEIGGDSDGKTVTDNVASGNARHGIAVYSGGHTIGGTSAQDANVATGNGGAGVWVQDEEVGNSILGNSIYDNDGLGIDLEPDGLTVNDPLDGDTGANNLQNFPVIVTAVPGSVSVVGELNSSPLSQFRIEFFHNDACDPSGFGEGKTFIGFVEVETDAGGNAPIAANFGSAPGAGFVTSTATHQSIGDTSEFSNCVAILSLATPTPTPSPEPSETDAPTPTATPSVTATPSGTDAPTDAATPTATAAPEGLLWGDVDCSGAVDPVDALKLLRHDAGLSVAQGPDCPAIGDPVDVGDGEELWGDVDCSDGVDPVDALKVLRHDAGLSVAQGPGCPEVGTEI